MPTIEYKLNTNYYQSSHESCWYAAYCMLFEWRGIPTSSIRSRIEKAGLNYTDFWQNGLPLESYPQVRQALGLAGFRRPYMVNYAQDLAWFADRLKAYGPMWCTFSKPSEHAVVVSGIDVQNGQIIVTNPASRVAGSAEVEYYTPTRFIGRIGSGDHASAVQMFM
jgi:hypothetical protein